MDRSIDAVTEQVLRLEEQMRDATVQRDAEALAPHLAEDFVFTSGRGRWGRERWLANLPRWVVRRWDFEDVESRTHGPVAVFLARVILEATLDGRDRSGQIYLTDVWAYRDARWQLLSRQWTAVQQPETD